MFRTLARTFLPNRLDWMLKRCKGKRILLAWNRGLGDIALGLFAMVTRIREIIPDAEVTFLVRENLRDGFELLEGVKVLVAPGWKRGEEAQCKAALHLLGLEGKFDLVIEKPSPTDWVRWQLGTLTPRLKWKTEWDELWKRFGLEEGIRYVGVQVAAETPYGFWRNWPLEHWRRLFDRLEQMDRVKVLLFGFGDAPKFSHRNVIDLRGKTSLFELLSIVKHRCSHLVLPDSGVLSMVYYLDVEFLIRVVSLWADPKHGILKQGVASPNGQLVHVPLIGEHRNLKTVSVAAVVNGLFPPKPLRECRIESGKSRGKGAILLAGGQGSRLGWQGPKGTFVVRGKSLFQWIVERAPERGFPIGVMTSPLNHEETVKFFQERGNFGREIVFFQQEVRPLFDGKKELSEMGPAGNGGVFTAFAKVAELFRKRGVDRVTIVPIDNALADVTWEGGGEEVVLRCVEWQKGMGALVEREGKIEIVEYLDLEPGVEYRYGNTGMMAMDLAFMERMAKVELPLRWVKKRHKGKEIWKRETFIFDALPFAKSVGAVCCEKNLCYAPLKSLENLSGIERQL